MALQLDVQRVLEYLQRSLPGLGLPRPNRLSIKQFKDGQSNPTYMLTCDTMNLVLRKAPPGKLLQGAHQVEREAHLMHAMKRTNSSVPLPEILLIEEDENVLGTKFFLMQYMNGIVYRKPALPDQSAAERAAIYDGLAACLAAIHNTPVDVVTGIVSAVSGGSAGFCRRQVDIWSRQYALSAQAVSHLPPMQRLEDWLKQNIPYANDHAASPLLSVVHGDFRLDNVIYGNTGPQAVLDWELGGIGDGTMDLAYCCLGYYLPQEGFLSSFSMFTQGDNTLPPGIPSLEDFVASYTSHLPPERACKVPSTTSAEWKFFLCLGLYRIASICAGVYSRAVQGNASRGDTALAFKDVVPQLAELALSIISAGSAGDPQAGVEPGEPSASARVILEKLHAFMEDYVLPNELKIIEYNLAARGVWPERGNKWVPNPHIESLRAEARKRGLWNLWCTKRTAIELQKAHPTWPWSRLLPHKVGLSHLDYAFIAIETGRSLFGAEACNCMAPDTGNMEVFAHFGTREQQKKWLLPLLDGHTRSCFGMTEPMTASSDPTQLQSTATKQGNQWVLQARKWWTTGACDSRCTVCIIIAITGGNDKPAHARHSFLIVPMNSPGVTVVRPLHVFGYDDAPGGHAETYFSNVVLGSDMLLGEEGTGFALAQSRLGPGRLHHCCRLLGHSERALQEVIRRGTQRRAFGKVLLDLGANNEKLALCRVSLRQAELTAMDAAHELDRYDELVSRQHRENPSAVQQLGRLPSKAIRALAICKIGVPRTAQECLDFAIQVHGGGGLSADHPLAGMWAAARTLRLVDGPDEVHIQGLSKDERKKQLLLLGKVQQSHPGIGSPKL